MIEVKYIVPFKEGEVDKPVLNLEEMKKGAKEFADKYHNLVVTEDNYSDSKVAAAEMNEVRTQLSDMKTQLRKKALSIVQSTLDGIDEVLEIIEGPYNELKESLKETKAEFDRRKKLEMLEIAQRISTEKFPANLYALNHLNKTVDTNCASKKGSWLTSAWKMSDIEGELTKEAERIAEEMDFIDRHVKGKSPEVVRYAKVFLVEHGFDSKATLDATDKYEQSLEETRRIEEERKARSMEEAKEKLAKARNAEIAPAQAPTPREEPTETQRLIRFTLEIQCPASKTKLLREFMERNAIKFRKIG